MSYLNDMFGIGGKTAVITGGAGAIGTVMSKALLKAGANVIIWSRSKVSVDEAVSKITEAVGSPCKGMVVDVGDEDLTEKALKESIAMFGKVDILINGAGGNIGKNPFVETDIEQFNKILNMNLTAGLMVPTKAFSRYWIKSRIRGNIINLASMASYKPLSGVWAYNAAKAGVLNLTQATANEFAPYGIRVNAIAPGFFIGKQNKDLLIDKETGEPTDRGRSIINMTPCRRFGELEELAGVALFLSSDKASGFVTGTSIPVDGGYLVHNI